MIKVIAAPPRHGNWFSQFKRERACKKNGGHGWTMIKFIRNGDPIEVIPAKNIEWACRGCGKITTGIPKGRRLYEGFDY